MFAMESLTPTTSRVYAPNLFASAYNTSCPLEPPTLTKYRNEYYTLLGTNSAFVTVFDYPSSESSDNPGAPAVTKQSS